MAAATFVETASLFDEPIRNKQFEDWSFSVLAILCTGESRQRPRLPLPHVSTHQLMARRLDGKTRAIMGVS